MLDANSIKSKPHYPILDGLRGVAAMIVVLFHLCEANSTGPYDQLINHGYLAVDFFFVLSGFVIGYAYDDRWGKLTIGGFFKRRLERLQPMVIMGMLIGAACFYFGDSHMWPLIHTVPVWKMLLIVLIAAAVLIQYSVTCKSGDLTGGWSLNEEQLRIGFTRLVYPFFAGLLLSRIVKPGHINNAFLLCSVLLLVVFCVPRIGDPQHAWLNGLFESLSIIFVFPFIIYLGASGIIKGVKENKICRFLGDISYPIYITHYAFIYIYTGWISDNKHAPLELKLIYGTLTFAVSIIFAYLSLKYYDEPVRAWLKKRWN